MSIKKISTALISVYNKEGLEPVVQAMDELGISIYSTGGTQKFVESQGVKVNAIEELTSYPSLLGGRVKTLHPKVFGGILGRRDIDADIAQLEEYDIPPFDLVIVDLYPFEETLASGAVDEEIIEKIDIGGISLIRAAAKNFNDVLIIPSKTEYPLLLDILKTKQGFSNADDRKLMAVRAFDISSHYDSAIYSYLCNNESPSLKISISSHKKLRYGENPHQEAAFYGKPDELFEKLHGKELSYNNLLDIDAAISLINDFENDLPIFAILKHNNACGIAIRSTLQQAYLDALASDPISAFGGVLITNNIIDLQTAEEINKLFCEVVIATGFKDSSLNILQQKKNRIILRQKPCNFPNKRVRSALNGVLLQEVDNSIENKNDLTTVTEKSPTDNEIQDLLFANKIVKNTKSNAIVLAKNLQLLSSGMGQTSRVDALKQAIIKAKRFKFDLKEAVMASDAFFPFPDCVDIAHTEGISAVIQPGGSIKDQESIDFCNQHGLSMVFTGKRHFKH